ncbi:MAG: DUF1499 domain-containing protein [Alphaproteobacteria bacterium]
MVILAFLSACGSSPPATLGLDGGRLAPCPDRPNCVTSNAEDEAHHIAPFSLALDHAATWSALKEAVANLPRTAIITDDGSYLHAEARSRLFGFVDDLEFQLRPDDDVIAIRSAARNGYSDLGVNAERIQTLRASLEAAGVLR